MALQKIPGRMIQLDSQANSDVMYYDGTDWVRLAKGEADEVLTVNEAADAPEWGDPVCTFPGAVRGYVCGGFLGKIPDTSGTPFYGRQIQKISLVTDGDSTDIGDLLASVRYVMGCSSQTHGFSVGGSLDVSGSDTNIIQRFPFASDGDAVDWADLTNSAKQQSASASSATHGWTLGGNNFNHATISSNIDRFPFASQTNATDWADATTTKTAGAGCSSITHGYSLGGTLFPGSVIQNVIEKYPFASQTDSVDVADITLARSAPVGVSSCDDAYCIGGNTIQTNPANSAPIWDHTNIDKHSFASGGNSTDHGDLPVESGAGSHGGAGMSGTTHGYHAGGIYSHNIHNHQYAREQIEKFAYASNVTASDVGDLVQVGTSITPNFGMNGCSGHQV
jgi:hypothetical protein